MTFRGGRDAGTGRAVSNVVGVTLLFGLVIVGALVVVTLGGAAVDDVRQENDMQVAQQSMRDLAGRLAQLEADGDTVTEFSLPRGMQGETRVLHTTTVNLTAHGVESCTTGEIDVATLVYENADGEMVGYEAGGVWRQYPDGGSTMESPPEINYRNGRLELSMSDIRGQMKPRIEAKINRSRTRGFNANLTRSLFTAETAAELAGGSTPTEKCDPQHLRNVTMTVSGSPFSGAWHRFAREEFDERRTEVLSRDPLEVKFRLGDVRDPNFEVNETDLPNTYQRGTAMSFAPRIENTGGLGGTQAVQVTVFRKDGGSWTNVSTTNREQSLSILPGETESLSTLTVPGSTLDWATGPSPRTFRIEIDTGDEVVREQVRIAASPADVVVDIDDAATPNDVDVTDAETVTVRLENTGGLETTRDFEFWFHGEHVETRTKTLPAGATEIVDFAIPTNREGQDMNATVVTARPGPDGDRPRDRTDVSVGDNMYFVVDGVSAPGTPTTGQTFQVSGTIDNTGRLTGEQDVTVWITHAENDTVRSEGGSPLETTQTLELDGDAVGDETETVTLNVPTGIGNPGGYEYAIETANDTATGSFRVTEASGPYFLVSELDAFPRPVIRGDDLTVTATVNNTGAASGTADVDVSFRGLDRGSEAETIDSGNGTTATETFTVSDSLAPGYYDLTVETDDTSLTEEIWVAQNSSGVGIASGSNTTITSSRNITASLTVLGTALTGVGNFGSIPGEETTDEIIRAPISMHIYTSNASVPNERIYAWGPDTDLNTPRMRMKQINENPLLNKTVTVGPGTSLSVFAESYYCDYGAATDVDIDQDVGAGADGDGVRTYTYEDTVWDYSASEGWHLETQTVSANADRVRCGRGGARLNISRNRNPGNLKILNRTESEIPNYREAGVDQRSAKDIIEDSSRVEINDTGHVQLEPDQRLLLYELSEPVADYDDAGSSGDPDYNDAVVLFEVVEVETTVKTDPDFVLEDTAGPAQVTAGDTATFEADVRNTGGKEGSTTVDLYVDGASSPRTTTTTGTITGGTTSTTLVDLSTAGLSPGIHQVTLQLGSDENQSETRNLYVGSRVNPYFVPNVESAPDAVEPGESIDLTAAVANVGSQSGSQDVDVDLVSTGGNAVVTPSSRDWPGGTLTLASGADATESFTFGTQAGSNKEGSALFAVATDNTTAQVRVPVAYPEFLVEDVYVGTDRYAEGDLIKGTNVESLDAVVENPAPTGDTKVVSLELDEDRDGTYEHNISTADGGTERVTLRDEATVVSLEMADFASDPGVYDYRIKTPDDTYEGTIRIRDTPDDLGPSESSDSDLISVDVNKIQLG